MKYFQNHELLLLQVSLEFSPWEEIQLQNGKAVRNPISQAVGESCSLALLPTRLAAAILAPCMDAQLKHCFNEVLEVGCRALGVSATCQMAVILQAWEPCPLQWAPLYNESTAQLQPTTVTGSEESCC